MRLIAFIMLACLMAGAPIRARADDPFTVNGVKVDITADNATAARDQGIMTAQRQAFEQLAATLKPNGTAPKLSDDKISDLVRDFAVENEQSGGNRYVASMTVRFRPAATRGILNVSTASIAAANAPAGAPPAAAKPDTAMADGEASSNPLPEGEVAMGTLAMPQSAPQNFLYVVVPAQNAKQLSDQRQSFMQVPGIAAADIAQINKTASTLRIGFSGSPDAVLTNMVSRGIALKQRPVEAGDKIPVFELTSLSQNRLRTF